MPKLVLRTNKEDGNVHDSLAGSVNLRAAFISLAVDVGGGIIFEGAFI